MSFWIRVHGAAIGLIRVFDRSDLGVGSPLLDLRLAKGQRGRGIGTMSVRWLTSHLFSTYPQLVRIEATTRPDNHAMQTVFERCGCRHEGRLVESCVSADGTRSDTLVYATLRREWTRGRYARAGASCDRTVARRRSRVQPNCSRSDSRYGKER